MNIGFDASDLGTNRADGTTRYTYELAKRLPKIGSEHQWRFYSPTKPMGIEAGENCDIKLSPWPKYWTQSRLPFDLYRDKPDVMFMPIQQIPYVRPGNLKTVAVVHDLAIHLYPEQFTYKDWLLLHVFSAYVAREADKIIAVSQATADDIKKYYGREKGVSVAHHGVDKEKFYVPSEEERAKSVRSLEEKYHKLTKPYILYVGQIQPRKNIIRLVEAYEMLWEENKELKLVIAGGHGWLKQPILDRVKKSKAKENILMLGRVPDELLPALYWQAEVFVLPSLYEGFGMPILESMACGCPVVTSDVSSMPEVAGEAGVLVNPKKVESIRRGIKEALNNKQKLVNKGLERVKQFSWDKTARETLRVIEQCL